MSHPTRFGDQSAGTMTAIGCVVFAMLVNVVNVCAICKNPITEYFDNFVEKSDSDWRWSSGNYNCLSRCMFSDHKRESPRKPEFLERVFQIDRPKINCSDPSLERNVYQGCKMIKNGALVNKTQDCRIELPFVCSLRDECHAEVCTANCTDKSNGDDCDESAQPKLQPNCFPSCTPIDCSDEDDSTYGLRAADGELYSACDQYLFISRNPLSHKQANSFCCRKNMRLMSLQTTSKAECYGDEIKKLNLTSTQFWTSATGDKCPGTFGWCNTGDKEFVDVEGLGLASFEASPNQECLAASFEKGEMHLKSEDCKKQKRVICERDGPEVCKQSTCPALNCSKEISFEAQLKKMSLPGGPQITTGCGKKFLRVGTATKWNFYKAQKLACASSNPVVSITSQEKLDCVAASMLKLKTPPGRYWVSAVSIGCPSVLRWCDKKDEPPVDVDLLPWKKGEPSTDPKKECTAVDFQPTPPHLLFLKVECGSQLSTLGESLD